METHRSPLSCDLFVLSDRDRLRREELVSALGHSLCELYEMDNVILSPSLGSSLFFCVVALDCRRTGYTDADPKDFYHRYGSENDLGTP